MNTTTSPSPRLCGRLRLGLTAGALVVLSVLATAASLRPDPRGQGTHEQLGLPPCTFLLFFGKRCPSCGMTTAWAHFMTGHPLRALQTHVCGTALAGLALAGSLSMLGIAATGRRPVWRLSDRSVVTAALVAVALVLLEWWLRW